MARRYGGKYSPDGAPPARAAPPPAPFRNRRVSRVSMRARLMYLLPLPLLFAGLGAIQRGSAPARCWASSAPSPASCCRPGC